MFSCSIRFFFVSTNEIVNLSVILQINITKTSKKKKEVTVCWSPASNNRKCNFYSLFLPRLKNFNSFLRKHTLLFLVGRILFHFFSKKCFKKKNIDLIKRRTHFLFFISLFFFPNKYTIFFYKKSYRKPFCRHTIPIQSSKEKQNKHLEEKTALGKQKRTINSPVLFQNEQSIIRELFVVYNNN